jgi:hypothetical protein
MIADCPYPPIVFPAQPAQSPPIEGYAIDWGQLSKMNVPNSMPISRLVSKQVLPVKVAADPLEWEFKKLVKQWKEDTFFLSSLTKQFNHPAYLRIMAMGKEGLPFVLREIQNSQDNWFYALKFMAGEDAAAGIKNFEEAKAAWVGWGYKNNYI